MTAEDPDVPTPPENRAGAIAIMKLPEVLVPQYYGSTDRFVGHPGVFVQGEYVGGIGLAEHEKVYYGGWNRIDSPRIHVPPQLDGIYVEFSASSPQVFEDPWVLRHAGIMDITAFSLWPTPGTPGKGGDPLKGVVELFWDKRQEGVRIRRRRDKGVWMEVDWRPHIRSWALADYARYDGLWRMAGVGLGAHPLPSWSSIHAWTIDNFYIYPGEPTPVSDFWTNFRSCYETSR